MANIAAYKPRLKKFTKKSDVNDWVTPINDATIILINISEIAAIAMAKIGKLSEPSRYGLMRLIENPTNAIDKALIPSGEVEGGIRSSNEPAAKPKTAALAGVRRIAKLITITKASGGTMPGKEIMLNQVDSTIPLKKTKEAITAMRIALILHFQKLKELEHQQ